MFNISSGHTCPSIYQDSKKIGKIRDLLQDCMCYTYNFDLFTLMKITASELWHREVDKAST